MQEAKDGVAFPKGNDPNKRELWVEALQRVTNGWLEGPLTYNTDGSFQTGGEAIAVNHALRFRARQADKLGAVDGLRRKFPTNSRLARKGEETFEIRSV